MQISHKSKSLIACFYHQGLPLDPLVTFLFCNRILHVIFLIPHSFGGMRNQNHPSSEGPKMHLQNASPKCNAIFKPNACYLNKESNGKYAKENAIQSKSITPYVSGTHLLLVFLELALREASLLAVPLLSVNMDTLSTPSSVYLNLSSTSQPAEYSASLTLSHACTPSMAIISIIRPVFCPHLSLSPSV